MQVQSPESKGRGLAKEAQLRRDGVGSCFTRIDLLVLVDDLRCTFFLYSILLVKKLLGRVRFANLDLDRASVYGTAPPRDPRSWWI